MPIFDYDGTTSYEIGKLYDNDGTTNHQIGKVYDNDGTVNSLIYTSEKFLLNSSVNLLGTPVSFYTSSIEKWNFRLSGDSYYASYEFNDGGVQKGGMQFPNLIDTDGATILEIQFSWDGADPYHGAFAACPTKVSGKTGDAGGAPDDAYSAYYYAHKSTIINAENETHTVTMDISNCSSFYFRIWYYGQGEQEHRMYINYIKIY